MRPKSAADLYLLGRGPRLPCLDTALWLRDAKGLGLFFVLWAQVCPAEARFYAAV